MSLLNATETATSSASTCIHARGLPRKNCPMTMKASLRSSTLQRFPSTPRQFKLQLLAAGLIDQVDGWITIQSKAVQIAYGYSGMFVRTEPMMAAGFAAMGFMKDQIDAFFTTAAAL